MKQKIRKFDKRVDKMIAKLPAGVQPFMVLFTMLGQPVLTVGVTASIIGIGVGRDNEKLFIAGCLAMGTIIVASLLKLVLRRKRPQLNFVDRLFFDTFSFPSGHAVGSIASYGTIAVFLLLSGSIYYQFIAALVTPVVVMIGISRIYLKAHYPSDVLGGWLLGLVGLLAITIVLTT